MGEFNALPTLAPSPSLTLQYQFQEERLWTTANTLRGLHNAINDTIKYCSVRKTFGNPVISNQVVQFRLAELQTEVELLRSLLYRAITVYLSGRDATYFASMCKLKAGRLAREVADTCLQYYG